jgi:hypothetical protein
VTVWPASAVAALARRGVTQPIAVPVPADDAFFLSSKGTLRVALRVLKRRLELAASGQAGRSVDRIEPAWQRAVWFHAEAPQIGDALMDLAPRSLLAAQGITLDLVAPKATAVLFAGDRWLARVSSDASEIDAADYDFAIVDSHAGKALAAKRRNAPDLPWVSVRADYLAYDYQRALLATRRFAELLRLELDAPAERSHSRQKLAVDRAVPPPRDEPPRVGLALGGVRAERTFRAWAAVASALAAKGVARFALLGSANGAGAASEVKNALGSADVLDLVGKTDLRGTQQAMARCALVACADGGLLHLACTTTTPLVALFDSSVDPAWRLPLDVAGASLRATVRDVNAIDAAEIAARALAVLALRKAGRSGPR